MSYIFVVIWESLVTALMWLFFPIKFLVSYVRECIKERKEKKKIKISQINRLLLEYQYVNTDWCCFGFDYEKEEYFIVFKQPYEEYSFTNYREFKTILKDRQFYKKYFRG